MRPRAIRVLSAMAALLWPAAGGHCDEAPGLGHRDGSLALVRSEIVVRLGERDRILHEYGGFFLVRLNDIRAMGGAAIHVLPQGETVSFRGWRGRVAGLTETSAAAGGLHVIGMIGPADRRWLAQLENDGIELLAPAHPHAWVVAADRAALERALTMRTSHGLPVVRGFVPLPLEARVHRSLVLSMVWSPILAEVAALRWDGRGVDDPEDVKQTLGSGSIASVLRQRPEIAYLEPVLSPQIHNNLAVRSASVGAEPLWDRGFTGDGVVVAHNDSGVDLEHPEFAGAIAAAAGRMTYTDTAHGSHTAGSIVGRGTSTAPVNTSGCGDLIAGTANASGMAPSATMVTNNIFVDGIADVSGMMTWAVQHGAHLSSNSWGLIGPTGPEVGYSTAAARADAAVRDADPDTPGDQPLTIFFSAGNTGPQPGTVTSPGTAKNVVTVGAVQHARCGAWVPTHQAGPDPDRVIETSGRGPSQGRVKPDVVGPGSDVLSLQSGDSYSVQHWDENWTGDELALNTGTSQACAITAGAGVLLHEALWRTRGSRPSPALTKAALVTAADPGLDGVDGGRGWGRVDADGAVIGPEGGTAVFLDEDETGEVATAEAWHAIVVVHSAAAPLTATLVWSDVPGEEDADSPLVNDLDLVLTSPSGTVYRGNVMSGRWSDPNPGSLRDMDNNVEVIRIEAPEVGTWSLEVVGVDVAVAPAGHQGQDFALVYSGDAGPCHEAPPAPDSVEAVPVGPNRIQVSWDGVSGASRYEVWRSERAGGRPYRKIAELSSWLTEFVDEGLSGGSDYFYVVRVERICWSGYSIEASARATGGCTLTPEFDGIASVTSARRSGCELEIRWEPATARCDLPVAYDVYRGDEPSFEPGPENLLEEDLIAHEWSDRGIEPEAEYSYLVRARHAGQQEDDGNTVSLAGRPSGPIAFYLYSGAEESTDEWLRVPGSAADADTEAFMATASDAWAGDRSWFVADQDRAKDQVLMTSEPVGLPAGPAAILEFNHRYRLQRGRDGGRLEYSTNGGLDWFDILAGDGQTVPEDPDRWRSGGYDDSLGSLSNPLFGAAAWTGDSMGWVHSVLDLEDFADRRVLLRWRFVCDQTPGEGWGWWIDEIRLVVKHACSACVSPPAPIGLQARPAANGVELEWWGGDGAGSYRLSRSTESDGPYHHLAEIAAPATEYLDSSASGGTTYSYVLFVDDGCLSDSSDPVTATAGGPCRRAPRFWGLDGIEDRRESDCSLDLHWRPAEAGCPDADLRYRIYRSTAPGFVAGPQNLLADHVAGPRFRDTTVADGELYHYRVRAVDGISQVEDDNLVQHSGWTTGPAVVHLADSVEAGAEGWWTDRGSPVDSGTEPWQVIDDAAHTGTRSWFCADEPRLKDQVLVLADEIDVIDPSTVLVFHHQFDLETFWDGGRLEYSSDGGASWHDMLEGDGGSIPANPSRFLHGGYNGFVSLGTGHPFAGDRVWTGLTVGWIETRVELADFVGHRVSFRWRLGCDVSDARLGWWLDSVELRTISSCVTVVLPPPRPTPGRRY